MSERFVRRLAPIGVVSDEPLALTPEARIRLDARLADLREARDRAAVTGSNYVITGTEGAGA